MFVLCPHCQFLVALERSGLPPAHCPRCRQALQPDDPTARAPGEDTAIAAPTQAQAAEDSVGARPVASQLPAVATADDADVEHADQSARAAATEADGNLPGTADTPLPSNDSFAAPGLQQDAAPQVSPAVPSMRRTPGTSRRWQQPGVAIPVLIALLVAQCLLADRAQLAADARWRPLVTGMCAALQCNLPAWHEPAAITLLDRNVVADPLRPGVLRVTAHFRNDARWPQAWPTLLLSLSDADGRVTGERLFAPRDYLGTHVTQDRIGSGQAAGIRMAVLEPAPRVVAFTFDFR